MTDRMPPIILGLVNWKNHHGQIWSDNVDRWIKCVCCDIQTQKRRRPAWDAMPAAFRLAVDKAETTQARPLDTANTEEQP